MKIAALVPYWNPPHFKGGISRVIFELRREWLAAGHEVHVYSPQAQTDKSQGIYQVPIPRVPLQQVWISAYLVVRNALKDYDIILPQAAIQAIFMDKTRCLPFIHTLSNVEEKPGWRLWRYLKPHLERYALKGIGACFALSDDAICTLTGSHGVAAGIIHKVRNGVDYNTFRPVILEKPTEQYIIFAAGRFIPRKRFSLLLRSFALLVKKYPIVRLHIAGEGKLEAELKALSAELGISEKVSFLGQLDQNGLLENYQKAQAFALSSEAEGMPMVVLEAQSCGLPVLISNFASAPDLVQSGINGLIVTGDRPEDWAVCMGNLVGDLNLGAEMGAKSRQNIIASFGWDSVAKQLEAAFISFLKK